MLFLVLPGFLTALLVHAIYPQGLWGEVLALFALAFCDSGHVYTTFWRTYANARERGRTLLYWTVPILVFALVVAWALIDLRSLFTALIFATVFHNYRQFHGILKWEQKINGDKDPWQARFLMALCVFPFFIFHFRAIETEFILPGAVLHFPQATVYYIGLSIYALVVFAWTVRVLWQTLQGVSTAPVTLAVLTPAALYALSFLWGTTLAEVLFPLVVAHGFAYMGLISLSLKRTKIPWQRSFKWWLGIIIATSLFFGLSEAQMEDWLLPLLKAEGADNLFIASLVALYLVPLLTHYIYDGWLWKSKHPEAPLIYQP